MLEIVKLIFLPGTYKRGGGGGGGEANAKHDTLFKGKTTTENSINGNT